MNKLTEAVQFVNRETGKSYDNFSVFQGNLLMYLDV